MEVLLFFWIVHYAESAFTGKIPYFQENRSNEKWYWNTGLNRVRTENVANHRNEVFVSFDEKMQILYIGDSKCVKLSKNKDYLAIVSKNDDCSKFTYQNGKLKVDEDINANEVCFQKHADSNKAVLKIKCTYFDLFFENVIELLDGTYVGADEGSSDIDSNKEVTTAITSSQLFTPSSTITIVSQEASPIHLSRASFSTQNENVIKSSVKPTSLQSIPLRSSTTYTTKNTALARTINMETSKLGSQSNHPQLMSSMRPSKAGLTTRNNDATKSLQPTSLLGAVISTKYQISNTGHFRETKKIDATSSVKRSTQKRITSTATQSTENVSDWSHPAQPGVMSNYVMKGYYINECIFKQINDIDDIKCFMECLKTSLCKSFTHSNKNRCIIYSCIIDKKSQNKVNTADENHAYYQ